jgi:hypothetical protein
MTFSGKHHTEEWRRIMSQKFKGKKGRKLTDKEKRNISERQIGSHCSEETKRKISESEKGKIVTEETKKKLSKANSLSWKKNPSQGLTGRHHSKETKIKLSITHKGMIASKETRRKMSKARKGRKKSKLWLKKISKGYRRHQQAVLEEINKLNVQGYKTLNGDMSPHPDILAFKDGKIYAYEIEFRKISPEKYNGVDFFDDIIWIKKERDKYE